MTKICPICQAKFDYEFRGKEEIQIICKECEEDTKKLYQDALLRIMFREEKKKNNGGIMPESSKKSLYLIDLLNSFSKKTKNKKIQWILKGYEILAIYDAIIETIYIINKQEEKKETDKKTENNFLPILELLKKDLDKMIDEIEPGLREKLYGETERETDSSI